MFGTRYGNTNILNCLNLYIASIIAYMFIRKNVIYFMPCCSEEYFCNFSQIMPTATTAATLSSGSPPTTQPAITVNSYGKGFGIAYAFFPGFHYQQSANWDDPLSEPSQGAKLPYGWGKMQRDIIVAPAKIANTQKPITLTQDQDGDTQEMEMIEACLLEAKGANRGIAIVLLNWSGALIENLTITINNSITNIPIGSRISSAQGGIVTPTSTSSQPPLSVNLSLLEYVDVITIEYPPYISVEYQS